MTPPAVTPPTGTAAVTPPAGTAADNSPGTVGHRVAAQVIGNLDPTDKLAQITRATNGAQPTLSTNDPETAAKLQSYIELQAERLYPNDGSAAGWTQGKPAKFSPEAGQAVQTLAYDLMRSGDRRFQDAGAAVAEAVNQFQRRGYLPPTKAEPGDWTNIFARNKPASGDYTIIPFKGDAEAPKAAATPTTTAPTTTAPTTTAPTTTAPTTDAPTTTAPTTATSPPQVDPSKLGPRMENKQTGEVIAKDPATGKWVQIRPPMSNAPAPVAAAGP